MSSRNMGPKPNFEMLSDQEVLRIGLAAMHEAANKFTSKPLPEWDLFSKSVRVLRFGAQVTVPHGPHDISVVLSGGLKLVYENNEVAEFYFPGSVLTSSLMPGWTGVHSPLFPAVRFREPHRRVPVTIAKTLEPSILMRFDYRTIEELSARNAQWGEVHASVLWATINDLLAYVQILRIRNASTRYQALMQRAGIGNNLTQTEIASYLGISRETLNRVLKRKNGEEVTSSL